MLVFIALIVIAFSQNLEVFFNHIHHVALLVIFHNIFAYILGYFTAKSFGLNLRDTKTIAMETGIQNGGLGLLLIFGFFEGLGGMALLAAFWGIWDVFSGLLLAPPGFVMKYPRPPRRPYDPGALESPSVQPIHWVGLGFDSVNVKARSERLHSPPGFTHDDVARLHRRRSTDQCVLCGFIIDEV